MRVLTLPFGGAIFVLCVLIFHESNAMTDRDILDKFYSHTGGAINWMVKWELSMNEPICQRKGITCDGDDGEGPVSDIDLNNNGLAGAIPPEIWLLPNLRYFSATDNFLYDAGFKGFTGAENHQVQIIDLSYNIIENVDGIVNAPYSLRYLMLTDNKVSGPFPVDLTSLTNMRKLYLNNNQITGTLPNSIGNITQLLELYLYGNELTGMIPTEIGSLQNLQIVTLAENKFSGTIPQEVNNLLNIHTFSAHNNLRSSGKIVGPLPSFEKAPSIIELLLSGNEMSGDIPSNLFKNAQTDVGVTIDLDNNYFDGTVPVELGRFDDLYLGIVGNELTGFSDDFCSHGKWMNGAVSKYGCEAIACPLNKFSKLGRNEDGDNICNDCDANSELEYVGGYACFVKQTDDSSNDLPQYYNQAGDDYGYGYVSEELTALTSFYMSMDPLQWDRATGWATLYSEGNDDEYYNIYIQDELNYCDEFYGIVCENNRITEIRLPYNRLSGGIHPAILKLKKLKVLDLSGNDVWFEGQYDQERYAFAGLENAESIEELDMSGTATKSWEGISNGTNLKNLYLNNLQMEGELSDEIYELEYLVEFEAKSSEIRGMISSEVGNWADLKILNLYYNNLEGSLPTQLGMLTKLEVLELSENLFNGEIPTDLNKLTRLTDLAIHKRTRDDVEGLTGLVPSFKGLTKLEYLSFDSNHLKGDLPDDFLEISGESYGRIFIGLEDNEITGGIPITLLNYKNLDINLSGNKIESLNSLLSEYDCDNVPDWFDGEVGRVAKIDGATGCDAILCPKGKYSYLGLANTYSEVTCMVCASNEYYGAKTCDDSSNNDEQQPEPEREALIDLYYATGGRQWANDEGWYQNMPVCSENDKDGFFGVTCTNGEVTGIDLSNNGLEGEIPSSTFKMPHLKELNLSNNKIEINLDDIQDAAETLEVLDVSHTKVTPFTEDVRGSSLSILKASNCSLTDIDGFYSLGGLTSLTLSDNDFEERLSTEIGNLESLLELSCNNCGLYGLIPAEIGNLEDIEKLDLGKNALSGPLPREFGDLTNLRKLILRENVLSGKMISFENDKDLVIFDVSNNQFSGSLPMSFLRAVDDVNNVKIDLSNNIFTGSFPKRLTINEAGTNVFIDLTGNEIESMSCSESYSDWMDGLVGILYDKGENGCEAILCPPDHYTKLGRAYEDSNGEIHTCEECDVGGNPHYGGVVCNGESSSSEERTALESLYQHFDGSNWLRQRNWMSPTASVCSWYGIKCNDELKVIEIELNNNKLTNDDAVNDLKVFDLPYLESFEVNGNYVPMILHNVTKDVKQIKVLGLSSTGAEYFGPVERFPNLKELYIGNNFLRGEIPKKLFDLKQLTTLEISKNKLIGTLDGIEKLSQLKEFYASNNDFTGTIPLGFGNLFGLAVLDISENKLYSSIPSQFYHLQNMRELYLQAQRIPGLIHGRIDVLSGFKKLERLGLEKNGLTGVIPPDFLSQSEKTSMAIDINLNFNELHGTIPDSLQNFKNLNLYIVGNKFEDLTDSFCRDVKDWLGGAVRDFGCDAIGCRKGTYNTLGRETKEIACLKCENSEFLGSTICPKSSADERSILMALYLKTKGEDWINDMHWGIDSTDICTWDGVECEGNLGPKNVGVTALNLESNGLRGPIPSTIFSLPYLRELNLKDNKIDFSFEHISDAESLETLILSETGLESLEGLSKAKNLKNLHLTNNKLSLLLSATGIFELSQLEAVYLNYNDFYGSIPASIRKMSKLESFFAYDNRIGGSIPGEIGLLSNLKEFVVAENIVSGQLPNEIGSLSKLELFSASRELKSGPRLDGTLPAFENSVSLLKLYLDYNNIGGSIPENFLAKSNNAVDATISHNLLTGSIPKNLDFHIEVLNLELQGNKIDNMDGIFCDNSAWMVGLVEFYGCGAILCFPGYANTNGRITRETPYCNDCPDVSQDQDGAKYFGSTSCDVLVDSVSAERNYLTTLYSNCNGALWTNSMNWDSTSHVCEWYGVTCNVDKRVTKIILQDNNLTGSPPKEIFHFEFLTELCYNGNSINFSFDGIDHARELTILHLGSTGLTSLKGISKAPSLKLIKLDSNQLSGTFPVELLELRNIRTIELGDNSLSGPLPTDFGKLTYLVKLDLGYNNFSGAVPSFDDNWLLEEIDLSNNNLDGYIPENFLENLPIKQIIHVDLSSNSIPGVIFEAIGRFENMEINFADNRIIEISHSYCVANDFGCDGIMCSPGTYNAIGRQDIVSNPCLSCKYGDAFYGSSKCQTSTNSSGLRNTHWVLSYVISTVAFSFWLLQ